VLRLGLLAAVAPLLEACGQGLALPRAADLAPEEGGQTLASLSPDGLEVPADVLALLQASLVRVTPNEAFYEQTDRCLWSIRLSGDCASVVSLAASEHRL
jgi:hypothetical protein